VDTIEDIVVLGALLLFGSLSLGVIVLIFGRDYEGCIGAKKHLVRAGPRTGRPRSNPSGKMAESTQWWKRSSGDGVAISAGIVSSVAGR
jgi:hypothetical protein